MYASSGANERRNPRSAKSSPLHRIGFRIVNFNKRFELDQFSAHILLWIFLLNVVNRGNGNLSENEYKNITVVLLSLTSLNVQEDKKNSETAAE